MVFQRLHALVGLGQVHLQGDARFHPLGMAGSWMTSSHEDIADLALETVRVWTSSGAVYDLRGRWLIRLVPAERTAIDGYDLAHLRRDGEPIAVVDVDPPVVGQRWRLLLRVREDGVLTLRETTPVVRVVDLASGRG